MRQVEDPDKSEARLRGAGEPAQRKPRTLTVSSEDCGSCRAALRDTQLGEPEPSSRGGQRRAGLQAGPLQQQPPGWMHPGTQGDSHPLSHTCFPHWSPVASRSRVGLGQTDQRPLSPTKGRAPPFSWPGAAPQIIFLIKFFSSFSCLLEDFPAPGLGLVASQGPLGVPSPGSCPTKAWPKVGLSSWSSERSCLLLGLKF